MIEMSEKEQGGVNRHAKTEYEDGSFY